MGKGPGLRRRRRDDFDIFHRQGCDLQQSGPEGTRLPMQYYVAADDNRVVRRQADDLRAEGPHECAVQTFDRYLAAAETRHGRPRPSKAGCACRQPDTKSRNHHDKNRNQQRGRLPPPRAGLSERLSLLDVPCHGRWTPVRMPRQWKSACAVSRRDDLGRDPVRAGLPGCASECRRHSRQQDPTVASCRRHHRHR